MTEPGQMMCDSAEIWSDGLGLAVLRLERLSRECFELAGEQWAMRHTGAFEIDKLYSDIHRELAMALGEIVGLQIANPTEKPKGVDETRRRRVFVAPNYRKLRGTLRRLGAASFESVPEFASYARQYGSLAEGSSPSDEHFFMPVAFWMNKLYEHELNYGSNDSEQMEILGFSKWAAQKGFLCHPSGPIYGLHFSFKQIATGFQHGLLGVKFVEKPAGISTALTVTEQFIQSLRPNGPQETCWFETGSPSRRKKRDILPFPIVLRPRSSEDQDLALALFSSLFYSNFREPLNDDLAWTGALTDVISRLQPSDPIRRHAEDFLRDYRSALKAASGRILQFDHFYAFLLNPGLLFETESDGYVAALGTLNFYTNVELPPLLVAIIRKHLEAIYHLLRDLEEWDAAKRAGNMQAAASFAHELKRVSQNLDNLIQPPNLPASGDGPPLFAVTRGEKSDGEQVRPVYGTIVLHDDLPSSIGDRIGLCFHPLAVKNLASLLELWCQKDTFSDVRALTGASQDSTMAALIEAIWASCLRLLALASRPSFRFRRAPASDWADAAQEIRRIDDMEDLAKEAGLHLRVAGALAETAASDLLCDADLAWLSRALLAILRDYSLYTDLGREIVITLTGTDEQSCTATVEDIPVDQPCDVAAIKRMGEIRDDARRADPWRRNVSGEAATAPAKRNHRTRSVVTMCVKRISPTAKIDRELDRPGCGAWWSLSFPAGPRMEGAA